MFHRTTWVFIILAALTALLAVPAVGLAEDDDNDDRRRGSQQLTQLMTADQDDDDSDDMCPAGVLPPAGDDDCDDLDDMDDLRVSTGVRVSDVRCDEGTVCIFTLRNRGATPVTANFTTANGSAMGGTSCLPGVDYISGAGSLLVAPNGPMPVAPTTVSVATCSDAIAESNETFTLNVTTVGGPVMGPMMGTTSATGTIREPGTAVLPPPVGTGALGSISVGDARCAEGSTCTFRVRQEGGTSMATVTFSTANGTAAGGASCVAGVDYVGVSGSVAVGPSASASITVQACSDVVVDPNETFSVTLASTTAGTIVDASGQGTIREGSSGSNGGDRGRDRDREDDD